MSLFSKLFGGGQKSAPEPVMHDGYAIHPAPVRDGITYRVGARIEKEIDGTLMTHELIRADTLQDHDTAIEVSVKKARQVIDEQGERLFQPRD